MFILSVGTFAQKTEEEEVNAALAFNDYCADITESLYKMGVDWGTKFGEILPSKSFKQLAPYSKNTIVFIEKSQKDLINKKVTPDMENLKLATLDYLSFEKQFVKEGFISFEELNEQSSDETIKRYIDKLMELAEKEDDILNNVIKEQEKLAKNYDYTIEEE